MKKREMFGYLIALHGAALTGTFAMLSGLSQLDAMNDWFIGIMVIGLLVALWGLFIASRSEEN